MAPYRPIIEAADPALKALVVEAMELRGTFVSCYAHVEFLLADICMKCWPRAEYSDFKPLPGTRRVQLALLSEP
jgi:hypothetical protein